MKAFTSPLPHAHMADSSADFGSAYPANSHDERGKSVIDLRCCATSVVVAPVVKRIAAPMTTAVFALVHAIIFNAPLMRLRVEVEAVASLAKTTALAVFASSTGAALTECVEITPASVAVVEAIPRLAKNFRNFSS